MKNRVFLAILGVVVWSASQGAWASGRDFLHYRDQPQPLSTALPAAKVAAEVKSLPHLWPSARQGEPKAMAVKSTVRKAWSPTKVMRKAWTPTTVPLPDNDRAPGAQRAVLRSHTEPPTRDVHDLPACEPVDSHTDMQDVAYPALRYSCIPVEPSRVWFAHAGSTVLATLKAWGKKAGWTVVWNSDKDWTIPASFAHNGQFEAVATWMFRQLAAEGVLCKVRFYEGNQTVVVTLLS